MESSRVSWRYEKRNKLEELGVSWRYGKKNKLEEYLLDLSSAVLLWCHLALTSGIRAGHLSYGCNPEGEDGHDCFGAEDDHVECQPVWSLEGSYEADDSRSQ